MGVVSPVTCAVRRLALEYGRHLLLNTSHYMSFVNVSTGERLLHEALALQDCGDEIEQHERPNFGLWSTPRMETGVVKIYVATAGSDVSGDGSFDKPFASLAGARNHVRTMQRSWSSSQCRPVSVLIASGIYYLPTTLVFTAADGGASAACRVIYRPQVPGTEVIVSGGVALRNLAWKKERDASGNDGAGIFSARLPPSAPSSFSSLFDGGGSGKRRLTRARWPNGSPETDLQPTGYSLASMWLPPKRCQAKGKDTTVPKPLQRTRAGNGVGFCENFPVFSTWSGGPATCRGFEPQIMFNETVRQDISTAGPPSGMALMDLPNRTWHDCEATEDGVPNEPRRCRAIVHVLNTNAVIETDGPWGNFQFQLKSLRRSDSSASTIGSDNVRVQNGYMDFGDGGWQVQSDGPSDEGPGTPTYFVENIRTLIVFEYSISPHPLTVQNRW